MPRDNREAARLSGSGLLAIRRATAFVAGLAIAQSGYGSSPVFLPPALLPWILSGTTTDPYLKRASGTRGLWRNLLRFSIWLGLGLAIGCADRICDPVPGLLRLWGEHGFGERGTPVTLRGRVHSVEHRPGDRSVLALDVERYSVPGRPPFEGSPRGPVRIRLTVPASGDGETPVLGAGATVRLTALVRRPRPFANPGAFDYETYLRARGFHLIGWVKSRLLIERLDEKTNPFLSLIPGIRDGIVSSVKDACGPDRERTAAFLAALLVGERTNLPDEFEEVLRRAGVYHIIALSGLNVGIVAMVAALILRPILRNGAARRLVTALVVIAYWAVAKESGSINRATLMAVLYLAGGAAGRPVSAVGTISVAGFLLLLENPAWLQDAGFQMTFGATLGILLLAPAIEPPRTAPRALRAATRSVTGSIRVSGAALLGTALISARHFQSMTPAALVTNLIAVPTAGLLLVLGLAIALVYPLCPPLGGALASLSDLLVEVLYRSSLFLAPDPLYIHIVPPPRVVVVWGGAALIVAAMGGKTGRRLMVVLLVATLALTAMRGRNPQPTGRLEIMALDVGQGDSILVRCPGGATILVDAGGFTGSRFDVGARVVAPALRTLGVLRLDVLVVTHAHRDHIGGAASILEDFSPDAVWLGGMRADHPEVRELESLAAKRGIPVLRPLGGVSIHLGGAEIEVIHPGPGSRTSSSSPNDTSLVLRVAHRRRAVLLTGDLEAEVENALGGITGLALQADLLKVAHHGSRTSTTTAFLERVNPSVAVISVGRTNPWGHPNKQVLDRLRELGVVVYRTDLDGAVLLSTDGVQPFGPEDQGRAGP